MEKRPYLIMVASQKGGVGKTTVAINLAVALAEREYKVVLVDADVATFSINEHLGIRGGGTGFVEAVSKKRPISESMFVYQPLDLHLVLGGGDPKDVFNPDPEDLIRFYSQITKMDFDFIIIDSSPGLFPSGMAKFINDVVIVTTPDAPSATSNAKLAAYCERLRLSYRLIINKSGYSKFELEKEDVEKLFGDVSYVTLPEDKTVAESLQKHMPVYMLDKGSPFSVSVADLMRVYLIKVGEPVEDKSSHSKKKGFFRSFADWAVGPKYKG